ncbi:rho-related GTP-binding protein RhoA-B isoform X2 [Ixodes scapularis]|uniref:rho-related GTP-binding protein RhoA-B isoform X2 n=1 Tax=Ixodes scapularis TaxID=6945 RepID=UPI001C380AF1|nr:rho-related GTP-binding protein RhoA-B isoform X2 [Ixodes scapularis]
MTKTKMADGDQPVDRKLVAVGDGSCGKTCLLISYCSEEFPTSYVPTVFETYSSIVQWCQQRASAVLVCFALDNRDSFVNVEFKWEPEIRHYLPKVPIVLVGNKLDLRESHMVPEVRPRNYKPPVSTREGRSLAERIRASAYVECSALTRQNIPEVFDAAIKASLQSVKYKKTLRCTLL